MKKYLKRDVEEPILAALKARYVAAILGARQTGKTEFFPSTLTMSF